MLTIKEYKKVESLAEAYELNQKKNNRIIAGGLWMKMGSRNLMTAIDLSNLQLDRITETEDDFCIGCMTTLRALETNPALEAYTNGALRESIRHIVGVQFRNCATIGGSIFGRFGFSDLLTLFLALETEVELYQAGRIPLREFIHMPYDNDILVALYVKKIPLSVCYVSRRNTATDFPVVACAVSSYGGKLHISIGARPERANVITLENLPEEAAARDDAVRNAVSSFRFGTNRRAGADYRRHVAGVLVLRALRQLP